MVKIPSINKAGLQQLIAVSQRILLTTHQNPDGDGLGSQIAMFDHLIKLDKEYQKLDSDSVKSIKNWDKDKNIIKEPIEGQSEIRLIKNKDEEISCDKCDKCDKVEIINTVNITSIISTEKGKLRSEIFDFILEGKQKKAQQLIKDWNKKRRTNPFTTYDISHSDIYQYVARKARIKASP